MICRTAHRIVAPSFLFEDVERITVVGPRGRTPGKLVLSSPDRRVALVETEAPLEKIGLEPSAPAPPEIRALDKFAFALVSTTPGLSLDAIVTGDPAADRNHSMVLWSERIIVALPEGHPLATNEIIYWTDLKGERFLLSERDPGPEIQDILVAKLSSPGGPLDVVRHDVSPENIKSLVGAGCGVSLMCEACMGASYAGVVYREARDGNGSTRIGYCAYWRDGNENTALRNFIRLLEERCPPVANATGPSGASSQTPDPSP